MSNEPPQGMGFDGWMKKFRQEFFTAARDQPRFNPAQALDDMGKFRALMAIDQRYMLAMGSATPGRVNPDVLRDIEEIEEDYRSLLSIGQPKLPFYTEQAIRAKIADTLDLAARAAGLLRDDRAAIRYYRAAKEAHRAAGNPELAQRCQTKLARLKAETGGNIDAEIRLLRKEISKASKESLAGVRARIDLGMLYSSNGDDKEARELLGQAEEILAGISNDPTGLDLASALSETIRSTTQEKHAPGPTAIQTKLEANELYRLLYSAYARIYAPTDPVQAAMYREKAAKRDSRQTNDEFSQAMLRTLLSDLGM